MNEREHMCVCVCVYVCLMSLVVIVVVCGGRVRIERKRERGEELHDEKRLAMPSHMTGPRLMRRGIVLSIAARL